MFIPVRKFRTIIPVNREWLDWFIPRAYEITGDWLALDFQEFLTLIVLELVDPTSFAWAGTPYNSVEDFLGEYVEDQEAITEITVVTKKMLEKHYEAVLVYMRCPVYNHKFEFSPNLDLWIMCARQHDYVRKLKHYYG